MSVEFGFYKHNGALKCFGAGVLACLSEYDHVMTNSDIDLRPFDVDFITTKHLEYPYTRF